MSQETNEKKPSLSDALTEAQSIVEAAEARAAEILAEVEESAAEIRENAHALGLEQGINEVAERAIRLVEGSATLEEELSNKAAKLALSICASIIGEHLKVEPGTATKIALKALQASVIGDYATIVVNPADMDELEDSIDDLKRITGGASIGLETSKLISAGGCLVKTEFGEVDATVESIVSVIAQRLGVFEGG